MLQIVIFLERNFIKISTWFFILMFLASGLILLLACYKLKDLSAEQNHKEWYSEIQKTFMQKPWRWLE